MYETEANSTLEPIEQLPTRVLASFAELHGKVPLRTLITWGEHCTECGWPSCYSTCDLYSPREDLRCRRFLDGMVRIECPESPNQYILKIRFKRWGMLWARSNFRLYPAAKAMRAEQRDYRIGKALQQLPFSSNLKRRLIQKRYALKKRLASRRTNAIESPTSFVLECYNPHSESVKLSIRIRSLHSAHPFPNLVQLVPAFQHARELSEAKVPFESLITVPTGFHRATIPFADIAPFVDVHDPFRIDITPNEIADGATLYFGMMDFVHGVTIASSSAATVKCVVWDLDNTLWDGILVEDGSDAVRLRRNVEQVIQELDRRGILQSVVSKNNPEEALNALRRFGLESYFLYPQISWRPKSEGISAIAQSLNIGVDSILFVDDSEFELQEVKRACHGVSVLNSAFYLDLLDRDDCRVSVTPESASRRRFYQVEATRKALAKDFGADYRSFLLHCNIVLELTSLTEDNLERVHELTQRTNQLNFSGNRYTREVLRDIMRNPSLDTYVLTCHDRFGSYGVVGFSIVDRREPRMTDLMLSCRVQSKRLEHAFVGHIIRTYLKDAKGDFVAYYKQTPRNGPAGEVFPELGLTKILDADGGALWSFSKDGLLPDEGVVTIVSATAASATTSA